MDNGFEVAAHVNTSLRQFPVLESRDYNKWIIAKPGTMHCPFQAFLSATKPNLHTQDISQSLGGFLLCRGGNMGVGVQGEAC